MAYELDDIKASQEIFYYLLEKCKLSCYQGIFLIKKILESELSGGLRISYQVCNALKKTITHANNSL